jgi:hypothetical protein
VKAAFALFTALLAFSSLLYAEQNPPTSSDDRSFEDKHPEGIFRSIVTAYGEELVMGQFRSFEIIPIKPSETFTPDTPEIFVVFKVHPHDGEYQIWGRWFLERGDGLPPNASLGTDVMALAQEDDSGYVSLKRPPAGWPIGDYRVEIHTGFAISDISRVGTVRFKVLSAKSSS